MILEAFRSNYSVSSCEDKSTTTLDTQKKAYKTITMPFQLTPEQIESYQTQGFLILRAHEHQLLSNPKDIQKWSEHVKNWPRIKGEWMPYDEKSSKGERILMRTENFVDYHPDFKELICGKALGDILATLVGEVNYVLIAILKLH